MPPMMACIASRGSSEGAIGDATGLRYTHLIRTLALCTILISPLGYSMSKPPKEHAFVASVEKRVATDRSVAISATDLLAGHLKGGDPIAAAKKLCADIGAKESDVSASKQSSLPFLWCSKKLNIDMGQYELVLHLPYQNGVVEKLNATVFFRSL